MKKSRKTANLVDPSTDQSRVIVFPDNWRSAYSTYTALYSGGLFNSERQKASPKEIIKQAVLLGLWIGVLTIFFATQRGLLHRHSVSPENHSIEARLIQPAKRTL
jgi:hypothetical protein